MKPMRHGVRHLALLALLIGAGFGIARGSATELYRFDGQAGTAENLGLAVAFRDVNVKVSTALPISRLFHESHVSGSTGPLHRYSA
jgi:hypothetical protein